MACAAQSAPGSQAPLVLGLIATGTPEQTLENWKPLGDALGVALHRPVHMVASARYAEIADGMKAGRIQLAWVNNRIAIDLVESDQARVFAQMVRLDGSMGYRSVLLVPNTSSITTLDDLLAHPGRYRFAAGDTKSMSGFLVPNYFVFAKNKISVDAHFSLITHGSHRENFLAVAEGRTDVATSNTEELPRFAAEMPAMYSRVRVLWESPLIPNDPILYRNDLDAGTQQRIKSFFVAYGRNAQEKAALNRINGLSAFRASSNFQLRPVVSLELFEALRRAMRDNAESPQAFGSLMEQITTRAARLEARMLTTSFDP